MSAEFVAHMEDVLDLYAEPGENRGPRLSWKISRIGISSSRP